MKSAEYWESRAQAVMDAGMADADKVLTGLERAYARAERQVIGQVESLYARYADKYGLTYDQAVKGIAESQYRQWRMTVADYVEQIMATGDEELLREFNTLSTRSRVARLEQVEAAIKVNVAELRAKQEAAVTELLHGTYENSYYRTVFDIQKSLGYGKTLELLNAADVARACAYPWSGASFSSRIWTNMDTLARELQETVTVGLIRGTSIQEMTRGLRDRMGVSRSAAERIIRTETARVVEDAELQSYKDCGVERYEILVQLDERTCKKCGPKDGQEHAVADARMGENYPPFHANCRCTTVAVFNGLVEEDNLRAAKDGKGNYVLVPVDMDYETWYNTYVQKLPKTVIAPNAILSAQLGFKDAAGIMKFVPKGTEIVQVHVIAGKGTSGKFRGAQAKADAYGGSANEWQKKAGKVESAKYIFDVHWVELDGKMYEPKIKNRKERGT